MIKKVFAVFVILFVTFSVAFAEEDIFSKSDKDKNDQLSKQEYMDAVSKVFNERDKNQDGVLTRDEIKQIYKIDKEQFIKATDKNYDGKITKEEVDEAAGIRFSKMDRDNDGHLSKKEWLAGHKDKDPMLVLFRF